MAWKHVHIEREGRVALVRFDRGDNLNALSLLALKELVEAAESLEEDLETTSVVLTGSNQAFCAGLGLKDSELIKAMQAPLGKRRKLLGFGPRLSRAWETLEQFTIAAINGHCVGGGVSLAVSCDFRVMGQNAFFRVPELMLGMNMSWQTLPRLVHLVGPATAKQIVILGERVGAHEALHWGLAQEVVDDGLVVDAAVALAQKIAEIPPLPVRMTKQAVNAITNALDHAATYMDTDQFMLCQMTQDQSEAISAFLSKRKPSFKGQ
jgi:enoyl-CoA hydratase